MKIVTGRTGKPHVTSEDDRLLQQAIWKDDGIFAYEESKMVDANTFRVMPINILFQGCHARILPGEYEDLRIDNGEAGKKRYDLIVARYEMDTDGIESINLVVIKGTAVATSGTAIKPSYIAGDINDGATMADMPLWAIPIVNLSVGTPILQCAELLGIKNKMTKGESYTKEESDTVTKAIKDSVIKLNGDLVKTNVNVEKNATDIKSVKNIAQTGKVIATSKRLTFSFESGTGGTNKQTFMIPAGVDGVFVVLKNASENVTYLGYDYTIENDLCTVTVLYNMTGSTGTLGVVAICTGSAAAIAKGASS